MSDSSTNPRNTEENLPSGWQAIGACVIGIGIGLALSFYIDHRPIDPKFLPNVQATVNQITTPINATVAKVNPFPKLERRTNILLMGVDSNGRNCKRFENTRSDTMILASLDPISEQVSLVSIPRDSRVRIADGHGLDKINAAHALGGPELAVKTVQETFGVPIDHYIVIDTQGLKEVCEIVGPIEVLVEKRMKYRDRAARLSIDLEPGLQRLTPSQVEEYCRFRHDQRGDLGRIERQQWFLRQAARKLKEPSVVLKLPQIAKFANDYIVTDLSVTDMAALLGFAKDLKESQIATAMLPGRATMIRGGSYYLPDPEASALVLSRMTGTSPSVSTISSNTRNDGDVVVEESSEEDQIIEKRPNNDDLQNAWAVSCADERPFRIIIRYPSGQEQTARDFEETLQEAGYNVIGRQVSKLTDCQHEQIVLNSYRADDNLTRTLKERFPELASFAIVLSPTSKTRVDATIQIAPDTVPLLPHETAGDFDYGSQDINGEVKAESAGTTRFPSHGPNLPSS